MKVWAMRSAAALATSLLVGMLVPVRAEVPTTAAAGAPECAPPNCGRPWHPTARTKAIFDDAEIPEAKVVEVSAADGTGLHLEIFVPSGPAGDRYPTLFEPTFYSRRSSRLTEAYYRDWVKRGYAFARVHLRGTGASGGCVDRHGRQDADDLSRVVEYLAGVGLDSSGEKANWANGTVGGMGTSYNAGALVNVAARGAKERTKYLKGLILGYPHASDYEALWRFDGVRSVAIAEGVNAVNAGTSLGYSVGGDTPTPAQVPDIAQHAPERLPCQLPIMGVSADPSGDHGPYFDERDAAADADQITAAVLMYHGHVDLVPRGGMPPSVQSGLFDRLGGPKAGIFGVFGHEMPYTHSKTGIHMEWVRDEQSMLNMEYAWFDHWLRGIDSDVGDWPVAQVQSSDGQWRSEPDWPATGGPVGHLALGAAGKLGDPSPSGATAYSEAPDVDCGSVGMIPCERVPGTYATFDTGPLASRLQLTGQPVLDLWVKLSKPDAHVAALLEVVDAAGNPVYTERGRRGQRTGMTYGLRSARHLEPWVNRRFVQNAGKDAPVDEPVNIQVRFQPSDLVIPAGHKLRLTVAGALYINPGLEQIVENGIDDPVLGQSELSGHSTTVTILHGCDQHASSLRFLMPRPNQDLLNVLEKNEGELKGGPNPKLTSDAGGLATAPVCGKAPSRLEIFGPPLAPARGQNFDIAWAR